MSGVFLSAPSVRTLACVAADVLIIAATLWLAIAIRFSELVLTYEGGLLKGGVLVVTLLLALYYSELYAAERPRP